MRIDRDEIAEETKGDRSGEEETPG